MLEQLWRKFPQQRAISKILPEFLTALGRQTLEPLSARIRLAKPAKLSKFIPGLFTRFLGHRVEDESIAADSFEGQPVFPVLDQCKNSDTLDIRALKSHCNVRLCP